MKLNEILQDAYRIEQILIENGGELDATLEAELVKHEAQLAQKTDSYAWIIKKLEHGSELYAKRAEQYAKLAKAHDNASNRLKDRIKEHMRNNGITELKGEEAVFRLSRSRPKVIIIDPDKVPLEYTISKMETIINKEKISEDLRAGIEVEGCVLSESWALKQSVK